MAENQQLSERELEILRLVATGASNKDIAGELVISVNTVKVHLRNIFSKLGVSSRTEATIYAVQSGLVPSPSPLRLEEPLADTEDSETVVSVDDISGEHRRSRRYLIGLLLLFSITVVILAGLVGINWWQQRGQIPNLPMTAQEMEQDRWEKLRDMTSPRSNFATVVLDGDIYMVGGEVEEGVADRVQLYHVDDDTWVYISDMPNAGTDIQAVSIGGKIFVSGGRLESGAISRQLLIYDPVEELWQEAALLPVGLSAYSSVAFEGKLYLFGGWDGTYYVNTVWQYDPSLNTWDALAPMPTARGYASAGISGGQIHVVGGYDGEKVLDNHEVYTPEQDKFGGNPWTTLAPLPEARYRAQIVSVAEIIHFIGGTNDEGDDLDSYKYFSQNDEWERFLIPMQDSWTDFGAEIVGEHIYIFGGRVGNQRTDQHYSYRAVYSIMVPILP